jgi:hypothetical protein
MTIYFITFGKISQPRAAGRALRLIGGLRA